MIRRAMQRRHKYNPKRRIRESRASGEFDRLAERVRYSGSAYHKRNPGDFGLAPPAQPRPDKILCDSVGIFTRSEALRLLREGVSQGMVSEQTRGYFPQNIWAVTKDGYPLEAQLENQAQGTYHGYPMPSTDDFREEVLKHWNR